MDIDSVTDKNKPDNRRFVFFQIIWWSVVTVGFMAAAILDPDNDDAWKGLFFFSPIWLIAGVAPSSMLLLASCRLDVFSWHPFRQVLASFVSFILLAPAHFWLYTLASRFVLNLGPNKSMDFRVSVLISFTSLTWIASAMTVGHLHRSQRAQRDALTAAAEKAEMELRFVRQQVNSHMVFNALNSIMAAIEEQSLLASSMVLDLSNLLRQSLETLPHMGILEEELKRVHLYLRIEKSRFEDNLDFSLDVGSDLLHLPCLSMVLQPLVENAVKHGFTKNNSPLHIAVRAERHHDLLLIRVTNQGQLASGGKEAPYASHGLGLHTLRRRLELEYGDVAQLNLKETPVGDATYVTATLSWPVTEERAVKPIEVSASHQRSVS